MRIQADERAGRRAGQAGGRPGPARAGLAPGLPGTTRRPASCGLSPFLAQRPLERPTTQSAPQSHSWDIASSCLLANICSQAVSPSGWRRRPGGQHVALMQQARAGSLWRGSCRRGIEGLLPTQSQCPPLPPGPASEARYGHRVQPRSPGGRGTRVCPPSCPPPVSHRQFRGTGCIGLNQWPFCRTVQSLSRETVPGAPDGGEP